jgi:hypothetical protein
MQLFPETVGAVLSKYYNCDDGVVRSVFIDCGATEGDRVCSVVVDCMQQESARWVRVCFRVVGVVNFRFEITGPSFEVLSSGVQVVWKDALVYLVLDAYPDDGPGLPELADNIAYVAGRECYLDVMPIP